MTTKEQWICDQLPRIRSYLLAWTRDRDVVEELAQEVAHSLVKRSQGTDKVSSVFSDGYVYQSAHHTYCSWAKKHNRRRRRVSVVPQDSQAIESAVGREPDPGQAVENDEQCLAVRRAIEGLPVLYRDIIQLQVYGSRTQEEIAREKCLPVGTVKTRCRTGQSLLRKELASLSPRQAQGETP